MANATFDLNDTSTWDVLVVDDEPDNLEVVVVALEYHGATVKTATDGLDGLAVLQEFNANIILLDLSMPNMNGWQMRALVSAKPETASIPVVALTAHAMAGDADRALAAGFSGYLTKPINIHTLINDIRANINTKNINASPKKEVTK